MVSAVTGLAGVGKTALAVRAAHAARGRGWFPGGVLFIDLHGYDDVPIQPTQALDAMLRALGVPSERIPPDAETRAALYRSVLAQAREPMLIVTDNASSETQVLPLLPGEGPHRLIATSRHTLGGLDARLVDVTVLDATAGVALLDKALRMARPDDGRIADDAEAAALLASICAGLPLALQIVAALLKSDPARQVAELAAELAVEHDRLERLRYDDGSGVREPSVAAAFEMSYRLLDEASARMFRLLPLHPGPDISTATAAVLAGLPVSSARNVLGALAKAHLIESTSPLVGRWRTHDLLRLYARRLSGTSSEADAADQARDRLFGYYISTTHAAVWHLLALPGVTAPDSFATRAAAVTWLDAEKPSLVPSVSLAAELGKNQEALKLSTALVEYLSWRRYVSEWVATAAVGLHAARDLSDQHSEAEALTNLGLALRAARQLNEAVAAHRAAAALYRKLGDRHGEGRALHNLGLALEGQRLFDDAIAAYQQDLSICRESGDWHGAETTLNSMSTCLREVGRLDEALIACQDAAAIAREIDDRQGEAMALNNQSGVLSALGRLEEAIPADQEALAIFREAGDQFNEAMSLTTLGGTFYRAQRFDDGIVACEQAAAIFRELGDRHGEGSALTNLAGSLLGKGQLEEAITADQDAVSIFRETGDRFKEGMSQNNLGLALHKARRFDAAIAAYQRAVVIFREIDHRPAESMSLSNLADSLLEADRPDEATVADQAAITVLRKINSVND